MNKINSILLFLYLVLQVKINFAQTNLVKNTSFEDTIMCPNVWGFVDPYVQFWHNPTASTPDYYNACAPYSSGCSVPKHGSTMFQFPKSGNAYCGIFCFDQQHTNEREFIQGQVIDSLIAGKTYTVSFYTNLANLSKYSISNIGAYFSSTAISSTDYLYLPYTPQVINASSIQLNDTTAWMEISVSFIANGGEKYVTIGNFNPDSTTDTLLFNGSPFGTSKIAYYYIDDVSVICTDCDTGNTINERTDELNFELFPNPNNGIMNFNYHLKASEKGEVVLYNIEGRKINSYNLNANSSSIIIKENDLSNGIYLYKIYVNDKAVKTDRIIIIK